LWKWTVQAKPDEFLRVCQSGSIITVAVGPACVVLGIANDILPTGRMSLIAPHNLSIEVEATCVRHDRHRHHHLMG